MPTYRGNIGNLLQHWVLCEIAERCNWRWTEIRFVDAYSMAPIAKERPKQHWSSRLFDYARDRSEPESLYERTWRQLAIDRQGYPNSANFIAATWRGLYSMLLCEVDDFTIKELRRWAQERQLNRDCAGVEVAPGDWRKTFKRGLEATGGVTLISFDPDMFNRHGSENGRIMTPSDLLLVNSAVETVSGPVVVQLSTYDVNADNSQEDVEPTVVSGLQTSGFKLLATVRPDQQMMSLVLGRSCDAMLIEELASLPSSFDSWLRRLKAGCRSAA
jgi:hypothetical protein